MCGIEFTWYFFSKKQFGNTYTSHVTNINYNTKPVQTHKQTHAYTYTHTPA